MSLGDSDGSLPPDAIPDPLVGQTLVERYRLTRRMGEGGMGTVYEAVEAAQSRNVAVKVLLDKYADRPEVARRLVKEAQLASSIEHDHIVRILDTGTTRDGRPFLVMELLRGESLADRIRREGALPEEFVITVAEQTASALCAAHARSIVHRDIKPENVFLVSDHDGPTNDMPTSVKIVDFGISKSMAGEGTDSNLRLTATGMVLGTPLYMAPEQARGDDELDERVDVYALGVILYEALTGEVPFRGNNYLGVISQVLSAELIPPRQLRPELSISPGVERIVMRAMQRDRTQRYASMTAMAEDLAHVHSGRAIGGAETVAPEARTRTMWPLFALLGVVTAIVLSTPLWEKKPSLPTIVVNPMQQPEPQRARVSVSSVPPGAQVVVNGKPLGITPRVLDLPRGMMKVTLTLDGFESASTTIDASVQHDVRLTLQPHVEPPHPAPPPLHPAHAHQTKAPVRPAEHPASPQGEETLPNPY